MRIYQKLFLNPANPGGIMRTFGWFCGLVVFSALLTLRFNPLSENAEPATKRDLMWVGVSLVGAMVAQGLVRDLFSKKL